MKAVSVKELICKILSAPFIVEQGTSDIWTYRKWSNGIAECWGSQSGPWTASFTQQAGGVFSDSTWRAKNIALPSGLFNSVDFADANVSTSGYTSTQVSTLNTTSLTFRAWNSYAASGMTIYSFVLHVKGTWK